MEEGEDKCLKYTVNLVKRCEKVYKKFSKKGNPKLLKIINKHLDQLETNPDLGEELTEDLKGLHSIHIPEFDYRIVYEVHKNPDCVIDVYVIIYRKDVYKELARYLGRG